MKKEYWLFTIMSETSTKSHLFPWFPSGTELRRASGGEDYAILYMRQLTEEQWNKLGDEVI